jgi:hypothetical protein
MQSKTLIGNQRQVTGKPTIPGPNEPKQITIKTLTHVKAKLYANADRAMKQNPSKADIIQKAVDRDAARLAFAINMVQIKL